MIPNKDSKKVRIFITTFDKEMESRKNREMSNKFICSICLNANHDKNVKYQENRKRKSKSCHVCHTNKNCNDHNNQIHIIHPELIDLDSKDVQTSQPDVTQGLNLLNEVLTVFQKNKETKENNSKTYMYKDACTSTGTARGIKPKLTVSRTFNFSIGDFKKNNEKNFVIVDYHQPDVIKISNNSLDLIRHKSSSIPQMKLEELKNSIKEKTKSKDAIEEVNRMFARVRKRDRSNSNDSNRPVTRNGPRVLPVVRTDVAKSDDKKIQIQNSCKCCQTNFYMSGGDSASQCCLKEETYEHTMCCHYKKHRNKRKDIVLCECCKNVKVDVVKDKRHTE